MEQLKFPLLAPAEYDPVEDDSDEFVPFQHGSVKADGYRRCNKCRRRLEGWGGRLYCMNPHCPRRVLLTPPLEQVVRLDVKHDHTDEMRDAA